MKRIILIGLLIGFVIGFVVAVNSCRSNYPIDYEYDAHVKAYYAHQQVAKKKECDLGVKFGGGAGISLGGCGIQPVLGFDGTLGWGLGL